MNAAIEKAHADVLQVLNHDLKGASVNAEINIEVLQDLLAGEARTAISIDLTREMVATTLMSMSADNTHIQRALSATQMIFDISMGHRESKPRRFWLWEMLQPLARRYPTVVIDTSCQQEVVGDEDALYHIMHNGVRNGVKHGDLGGPVTVSYSEDALHVVNEAGKRHHAIMELLQNRNLMDSDADSINLLDTDIGQEDSSFQGCRDMRKVIKNIGATASLTFGEDVHLKILLPPIPHAEIGEELQCTKKSHLKEVRICCADDQNAPRLQVMNALQSLSCTHIQNARTHADIKDGIFRDEPHLKLYGRNPEEVAPHVWEALAKDWANVPAVIVLDQHLDFGHMEVYGTDICKQLRQLGFCGVIAIRSGNDTENDERKYISSGADIMLSKTLKVPGLAIELKKLMAAAYMSNVGHENSTPRANRET